MKQNERPNEESNRKIVWLFVLYEILYVSPIQFESLLLHMCAIIGNMSQCLMFDTFHLVIIFVVTVLILLFLCLFVRSFDCSAFVFSRLCFEHMHTVQTIIDLFNKIDIRFINLFLLSQWNENRNKLNMQTDIPNIHVHRNICNESCNCAFHNR